MEIAVLIANSIHRLLFDEQAQDSHFNMIVSLLKWIWLPLWMFGSPSANEKDTNYNPFLNIKDTITVEAGAIRYSLLLADGNHQLNLRNLIVGETYQVWINRDPFRIDCAPKVGELPARPDTELPSESTMTFRANGKEKWLLLSNPFCAGDLPITMTMACNSCSSTPPTSHSIVSISTDFEQYSTTELVKDVFVGGDCFQVEDGSIEFTGDEESIGYFSNGETSINIEDGIILSSGEIKSAEGSNNAFNTGSYMSGTSNDPDLDELTGNSTVYDRASLEFDFTPTDEIVSFEYVFASEEYCEYVNSGFNDAFGFFISGPGINGPFSNNAENIAVVPSTNDYISINTINHLQNSQYYRNNIPAVHHTTLPFNCDSYPTSSNGVAINDTEYDGFTTVMTAMANVIPCETYHIKLVIADLDDAYFDSAVFLKANSFSAGGTANVTAEVPGFGNNEITESCTDGFFIFERTNDDLTEPLTINYIISNLSTAIADVDYEALPDSITIPAGDSIYYLPVNVFDDQIVEGSERIVLELDAPCSCDIPFIEMLILDGAILEAMPMAETLCLSESINLSPTVSGGLPGYTYLWSTNDTTSSIDVNPLTTTAYGLTVTDYCGNTVSTTMDVEVVELPEASISGFVQVCPDNPQAELEINFTGTGPWDIEYSINNINQTLVTGITENPYILQATTAGTYFLLSVESNNCEGSVQGAATVLETNLELTSVATPLSCPDLADGSIELMSTGGQEPYAYLWNTNDVDPTINGLDTGMYWVTVTDFIGCTAVESIGVSLAASIPLVNAGADDLLNCTITSLDLQAIASNGQGYDYLWTTTNGMIDNGETSLTPQISEAGDYILEVTNVNTGCTQSDTLTITADTTAPLIDITVNGPTILTCAEPMTELNAINTQPAGQVDFNWSTTDGTLPAGMEIMPIQSISAAGTYELLITNQINGCTATNEVTIVENQVLPSIDIAPSPTLTCNETTVQLDATNSSSGNDFLATWTSLNGNLLSGTNGLTPIVDEIGTYELTIIDQQNGCENSSTIEVFDDTTAPIANIELLSEKLDCDTDILTLSGNGSSIGNDFSYQWTSTDGQISSGPNTLAPEITAPGTYVLMVTNMLNGCTEIADVQAEEDMEAPLIQLLVQGSTELTCESSSTVLNAMASEPAGELIFEWSTIDGVLNPNEKNQADPEITVPGTYELMITNLTNGCTSTENILISLNDEVPQIEIATPDVITCFENSIQLDATNSSQGPDFTIQWTTNDGHLLADVNTLTPQVDEPGVYELTITNTDNGCSHSQTINVEEDRELPFADAGLSTVALDCNSSTLELSGSASAAAGFYSYRWSTVDGDILQGVNTLNPTIGAAGVYQLLVTNNNNGCVAVDEIQVTQILNIPTDVDLIIEPPLCFGDAGNMAIAEVIGGEGPYLYSIDAGQNFYTDSAYVMLPGNYTLHVQDMNGCDYVHQVLVPNVPDLQVGLQPDLEIQLGEEHQLIATVNVPDFQIDTIIWSPAIALTCADCLDPIARPFDPIVYEVTVITENGCIDSDEIAIEVRKDRDVYIPNAFSPNEDGNNDVFMIFTNEISIAEVTRFQVFSRWGELVFSRENFPPNETTFGWDGRFKDGLMNTGVYVYFAEIEFIDGERKMYKGDVVLMK